MKASEYQTRHLELMMRWENECREWLKSEGKGAVLTPFFEDGIIDPETWFENEFRPLFILKEVHDKTEENKRINFVAMKEGPEYDIWTRKGMWKAFGVLAKGIISRAEGKRVLSYVQALEEGIESYREVLKRIAVINVKKLAGGGSDNSERSRQTFHFTDHADRFKEYLYEQITTLIKPTVIVFCGKEVERCFAVKDGKLYGIPAICGLHPSINPNCRRIDFYDETVNKIGVIWRGNFEQRKD